MRGKVAVLSYDFVLPGITPAYAGKRLAFCRTFPKLRDHPRLCGEKDPSLSKYKLPLGSPPPMRGKENGRGQMIEICRITPAYAGKRFCRFPMLYS